MDRNQAYIDALLAERQGYEMRGMKDRVADVDAELASVGYKRADKTVERAVASAPEKR